MSPVLAQHAAATVEHGTPHEVVAMARDVLGRIDVDLCSNAYWNKHSVQATTFFNEQDDALDPDRGWPGAARGDHYLVNPPGGKVKDFWRLSLQLWLAGAAVFWVGFNLEQLVFLQAEGALYRGFVRCLPPRRLAFLRRPGDIAADLRRRADEAQTAKKADALIRQLERLVKAHPAPNGAPVPAESPTHGNYLLLMPSELDQVERFRAASALLPAEVF